MNLVISADFGCHARMLSRYSRMKDCLSSFGSSGGVFGLLVVPAIETSPSTRFVVDFLFSSSDQVLTRIPSSLDKQLSRYLPTSAISFGSVPSTAITGPLHSVAGDVGPGGCNGGAIFATTLILFKNGMLITIASMLLAALKLEFLCTADVGVIPEAAAPTCVCRGGRRRSSRRL